MDANVGVAFAVPVDTARKIVDQLSASGSVEHAWLGVSTATVDAALSGVKDIGADTGALVTGVVPGGPAQKAGLEGGDRGATADSQQGCVGGPVVTSVDGRPVEDAADLYTMVPSKVEHIPTGSDGSRLGRTAYMIADELKLKSEMPIHTLVGSLGIPLCARSVCKTIADAGFDDLAKMRAATVGQIAAIPGLGQGKAESFVKGLAAKNALIDKLLANGVRLKVKSVGALTGKSVCMTGFRAPDMEKAIEDAGGSLKSSVGKGLTYLVAKDPNSGSEKAKKATSLGVQVIGIDDMWALLGKPKAAAAPVQAVPFDPKRKKAAAAPPAAPNALDMFGDDT